MKFTLSWLKDHLDTDATVDQVAEKLTMLGLEVEGVEDRGAALRGFTIVHVKEARQHPNADRLRVCDVETKDGMVQVVCGAPNARTGMKGVFAASGMSIPGTGITLKPTKIRDVESNGMLCSERELMMSDDHDGIIDLPEDAPLGMSIVEYLGLDDPVIEIAITPDRGDCLGVRGIARDLAAAGLGTLKPLDTSAVTGTHVSPIGLSLDKLSATPDACPMFVGRHFQGVKNGPSPEWMQRRLTAIGLRPISALVDITNYVSFDLGRPLHVFDADTLSQRIAPRLAEDGEKLLALDEKEYTLTSEVCVIADEKAAHGIGGVMGGEHSGCTEETVNVFLEVATFDPIRTAMAGRTLGIDSDARYRFERGVDPEFLIDGAEIATRLILELCGGNPSELLVAGGPPEWKRSYGFRPERVAGLGGLDVPETESLDILQKLGFTIGRSGDAISVSPPSWRWDIHGEADLVEEVLRIKSLDSIPAVSLPRDQAIPLPVLTLRQRRSQTARRMLAARGMHECVTWSFMPRKFAELFGGGQDELMLANPISSDLDCMRPSMLPNLIDAARRNAARGMGDVALFELGPQYAGDQPGDQALVAAGVRAGDAVGRHWSAARRPVDAYDAKADAVAALAAIGAPVDRLQTDTEVPAWYHPGRAGRLALGPKNTIALFGDIHPRVLKALDIDGPVVAFEIFIDNIPEPKSRGAKTRNLLRASSLQPVERDFAFVVDEDVPAEKVLRAAKGADKALIVGADVFDVYRGASIGEGRKSLAVSVTLQPVDATLTDEQIEKVAASVVKNVEKQTGGTLRG
jgi:phenylalanyl-tRNA synthetase beta chain